MNNGTPSADEKDQVKLNQSTSNPAVPSSNPSDLGKSGVPEMPTQTPNPPTPSPQPATSPSAVPTAIPLSGPPSVAAPPPEPTRNEDVGVGKPNIGVELENKESPKDESSATISVSTSEVNIPAVAPTSEPPEIPKPVDEPPEVQPEKSPMPSSPLAPPSPTDNTPSDEPEKSTITTQTQDIPIKSYDSSKTTDNIDKSPNIPPATPSYTPPNQPTPPVKTSSGSPAGIIAVLAILALILGAGGGFFGFRYYDKAKVSASTETTATPASSVFSDINSTTTKYSNDKYKYSLAYPSSWATSTTDIQADSIVFASDESSLSGDPSGYKVEVNIQDSNGKTLKNWVDANSVSSSEKNVPKEITVSGQTAYQQTLSNIKPGVATYIELQDKIMIVTYTAQQDKITEGAQDYNTIINSITLI